MKTKQTTKHALWASVTAIALCMVMLVGTTFAWFTDTATANVNTIKSGELKVDIVDEHGVSLQGKEKALQFVKSAEAPVGEELLWEPGCTYRTQPFRIKNDGNLALKYTVVVNGTEGDTGLLKVIKFQLVGANAEPADGHLSSNRTSEALYIQGHMDENAGNDYQNLTLTGVTVTVYATQYTEEYDSNGNTYDEKADFTFVTATTANAVTEALDAAEAGDILVFNGTVAEPVEINKADVTLVGLTTTAPVTVNADNVTLDQANIAVNEASKVALTVADTTEDVVITNSTITANTTKSGSHCAVSVPVSGNVTFTNNTVTNDYNGIEFSVSKVAVGGATISGNTFNTGNNAINIYKVEDGAVFTIENNTFNTNKRGNMIRLSNHGSNSATFDIKDNIVHTSGSWENAFVLLEDFSAGSDVQDFTKFTLNFTNNTLDTGSVYTIVYDDQLGIISTNQPVINVK